MKLKWHELKKYLNKVLVVNPKLCWDWQGRLDDGGYGSMTLRGSTILVHRIAWIIDNGEIPKGMNILHKCDNPKCVNPDHLFLGTHFDNMRDMAAKGRAPKRPGSKNPNSKLNESKVREIKNLLANGKTRKYVSTTFEVSLSTIDRIINKKSWRLVV